MKGMENQRRIMECVEKNAYLSCLKGFFRCFIHIPGGTTRPIYILKWLKGKFFIFHDNADWFEFKGRCSHCYGVRVILMLSVGGLL